MGGLHIHIRLCSVKYIILSICLFYFKTKLFEGKKNKKLIKRRILWKMKNILKSMILMIVIGKGF